MIGEYDRGNLAKHPNVAKNFGYGQDQDGDICLVMELLEGGDFRDLITNKKKRARVTDGMLFSYIDQYTAAMDNMHKKGVIHRDLKPENLMLSKDWTTIKIIDFGISKFKRD